MEMKTNSASGLVIKLVCVPNKIKERKHLYILLFGQVYSNLKHFFVFIWDKVLFKYI